MPEVPDARTIEDATCLGCGCLCDDIALRVEGGRIVEAANACDLGRGWFLAEPLPAARPLATIEGRPVPPDEAIERAVAILTSARSPIVTGLTLASVEAQAKAVAVADRLGAAIDPTQGHDALPRLLAVQRAGRVSATWGEVKGRADVVVFWGVDPLTTHPRHWERYSVEPRGRFVPEGRAGRHVIVVDAEETATSRRADRFVRLGASAQLDALTVLRALIRGARLDPARVEAATGLPPSELASLADRLKAARYGAIFFGDGLGRPPGGSAAVEALLLLVRELNESTRFVAMTLGGPANAAGVEAALAWQAGAAVACDFARGYPRFLPAEATVAARLALGEADAALIVADDPIDRLPYEAAAHLSRIPAVVIAPNATDPARGATVGLASGRIGIETGGSVMRTDGVSLPLRPALDAGRPAAVDWLGWIEDRLLDAPGRA